VKVLNPNKNLASFFDCVRKSANRALLLDYDGTLAPFTTERDKAFPYAGVTDILEGIIQNSNTRLVLISGRQVEDLIPLIGLEQLPEIWGSHGGESRSRDGTYRKASLRRRTVTGLKAATDWMAGMGWSDQLERKPLSVALHWRGLRPEKIEEIQSNVLESLPRLIEATGLSFREFDGGVEVRPQNITKANAVQMVLTEIQSDAVAYLGDDSTDEDAFAALEGRGLAVLVRQKLRRTKADVWLRPPEELVVFLRKWEKATSYEPSDLCQKGRVNRV
jgi:trehalose 6-phosphate phosphatase